MLIIYTGEKNELTTKCGGVGGKALGDIKNEGNNSTIKCCQSRSFAQANFMGGDIAACYLPCFLRHPSLFTAITGIHAMD